MKQYYIVKNGKLVAQTIRDKSILPYIFWIMLVVGAAVGSYVYAMEKFAIADNNMVVAKNDYDNLKIIEADYKKVMEQSVNVQEYVLSKAQLKEAFEHAFPEVSLDEQTQEKYLDAVALWSAHYSIPPLLVLSIIWRESFFDATTHSTANARGPMQVIYVYHKEKLDSIQKGELDLHEIDTGVRVGVQVLREYFDRYDRNIFRAMQAYVGGEHKTYARDILTRYFNARIYMEEKLPPEKN